MAACPGLSADRCDVQFTRVEKVKSYMCLCVCGCVCLCIERRGLVFEMVGDGGRIAWHHCLADPLSQPVDLPWFSRHYCDSSSLLLQDLAERWAQHSRRLDRQRLETVTH